MLPRLRSRKARAAKMNKRSKIIVVKYVVYSVIMLMLYVAQTTPGFLSIRGIRPILVLPFAVCVAMFDSNLAGGLFGLFAGILCDTSSSLLFGVQAILYLAVCVAVGLLIVYYMQPSLANSLIFVGCGLILRLFLEFFFAFFMWGYDNIHIIVVNHMLPLLLYTLAATIPVFWLVRKLHGFFEEQISR